MWTEKEISRAGETFINSENKLEDFCDNVDLGKFTYYLKYMQLITLNLNKKKDVIKKQGTTYYNLKDAVFAPKVIVNIRHIVNIRF